MSNKPSIDPLALPIHPDDSLAIMGAKLGMRHAQAAEKKAAEKAKQPPEASGLDSLGAEDYDPKKHGPLR